MKVLLAGNGPLLDDKYKVENVKYIDLTKGYDSEEVMEIYEQIDPAQCSVLRNEILNYEPDLIIGVGVSKEYKWDATIIARVFGQFTSWHNQWKNAFGKTVLKVGDKDVELYAFDSLADIENYIEL